MSDKPFVHLHCHTADYSLLDGACETRQAHEDGQRAGPARPSAMTDHGNLFGAVEFLEQGTEYGVHP